MLGAAATPALSILHGVGVLALVALGTSMLQLNRLRDTPGWRRSLVMGLLFGATVALAMLDPIAILPGVAIDPRGGPAMLAGVYGGPVAAIVTAAIGCAVRWWIGGAGAGMIGLAIYAAAGTLAWHHLRRSGRRPTLGWLLGLAVIGSVCAFASAFAFPDWRTGLHLLSRAWWLVLAGNIAGVLVLGILLERDWRRRMLEDDLRQTGARARSATEAQTRFLASMSHEIRTPMNAVTGFVDLLCDSNLDNYQRRCAYQVRNAAQGLLRVVDDILDFAKLDAGDIALARQPVDMRRLTKNCRELLLPQLEAKGLACTIDVAESLPAAVDVDPARLQQMLLNLLGSAVKFSDAGRVTIALHYTAGPDAGSGELVVAVAGTGIGMNDDDRSRLFSPFAQGDHVGFGGTGLGLAIGRMLVEAMDGEMTVKSIAGEGTTVTARIPAGEAVLPSDADADRDSRRSGAMVERPLRVLVAEDVALNAEVLQATLEQAKHIVHVVTDGQHAVDAVLDAPFDIVLMDVQMPVMDGLAATRAIRAMGGPAASIPIIALTAYASREDLKACLDAGMNDFLTKPLERAKLQRVLEHWGGNPGAAGTPATESGPRRAGDDGPGHADGDENVERVGELLNRLTKVDRNDRDAMRSLAEGLVSSAENLRFQALAERSRRLVAASGRSNADALGALIEDVTDAGRRALQPTGRAASGDGR